MYPWGTLVAAFTQKNMWKRQQKGIATPSDTSHNTKNKSSLHFYTWMQAAFFKMFRRAATAFFAGLYFSSKQFFWNIPISRCSELIYIELSYYFVPTAVLKKERSGLRDWWKTVVGAKECGKAILNWLFPTWIVKTNFEHLLMIRLFYVCFPVLCDGIGVKYV